MSIFVTILQHLPHQQRTYAQETAASVDKQIDQGNLGNKMLRGMGWQDGSGLGKYGHGITAPVNAMATVSWWW